MGVSGRGRGADTAAESAAVVESNSSSKSKGREREVGPRRQRTRGDGSAWAGVVRPHTTTDPVLSGASGPRSELRMLPAWRRRRVQVGPEAARCRCLEPRRPRCRATRSSRGRPRCRSCPPLGPSPLGGGPSPLGRPARGVGVSVTRVRGGDTLASPARRVGVCWRRSWRTLTFSLAYDGVFDHSPPADADAQIWMAYVPLTVRPGRDLGAGSPGRPSFQPFLPAPAHRHGRRRSRRADGAAAG